MDDPNGIREQSVEVARTQHKGMRREMPFNAIPAEPHAITGNPIDSFEPLPPAAAAPINLPMDNPNELRLKSLQEPPPSGNLPTAHPLIVFSPTVAPMAKESDSSNQDTIDEDGEGNDNGDGSEEDKEHAEEEETRMTGVEGPHQGTHHFSHHGHKSRHNYDSKPKRTNNFKGDLDDAEEDENENDEEEHDTSQVDEDLTSAKDTPDEDKFASETRKEITKKSTAHRTRPEFTINAGQGISIYSWEDHVAKMEAGQSADEAFAGDASESSEQEDDRQEEEEDVDDGLEPTKESMDESEEEEDDEDEDEEYEMEKKSTRSQKKIHHKSSKSGSCSHSENNIVKKMEGLIARITGKLTKKITILPNDSPNECFHSPWKPGTLAQFESCYRAWGMTQKVAKCWAKEETTKWSICAVDCGFMGQKKDSAPCLGCLADLGHQKRSCSFTALGVGMNCQKCRETAYHHYDSHCVRLCRHAFDQAYGESPSPECRSCSENFHTMLDECS